MMFDKVMLPSITNLQFSEKLTMDTYILIIRKMLACVRHVAYQECQAKFNDPNNRKTFLTEEEADALLTMIQETKQENFRLEILARNGVVVTDNEPPKRIMQRAYLTYATLRVNGPNNKPWMTRV